MRKQGFAAPSVDIEVINEDLIHKAVEDERKVAVEERQSVRKGHGASDTVLSEPIELGQIEELALSFKNIVRVDNLVGLHSLTTLRLDNNIISRVENLAHLAPTLTYLDLSFNNIDSVDGLEALVNLTDLSLFNNNVSGGLAKLVALSKLQVLSVGNNSLSSVEELKCLRKLSSLRALSVEGNPLSDEKGEHKTWIYAFLPQLHYLDWVLIQDEDKRQAREHLQDELQEEEDQEEGIRRDEERRKKRDQQLAKLRDANIELIEGLFEAMFAEDSEMSKLKLLPGADVVREGFREVFEDATEAFKKTMLDQHGKMVQERKMFDGALTTAREDHEAQGVDLVRAFERRKKHVGRAVRRALGEGGGAKGVGVAPESEVNARSQDVEALRREAHGLRKQLWALEEDLAEQSEDLIGEFDTVSSNMSSRMVEEMQGYFRSMEGEEQRYTDAMNDLADKLLNEGAESVLERHEVDLPQETDREMLSQLLSDRDSLTTAVSSSHDVHVSKLMAVEDKMRQREKARQQRSLEQIRAEEAHRNRQRLEEIRVLHKRNGEDCDTLHAELTGDGDDM